MHVVIDAASSTPVHEQLRDQIHRLVLAGALAPKTRLPAIRQLANDLGLAPGTVARAYRDLEQLGILRTRRPQGTFVTDRKPRTKESETALRKLALGFAQQAQQLGATGDDALAAVQRAYQHGSAT